MIARSIANTSGGCSTLPVVLVGAELFLTWCIPMNVDQYRDLRNRWSYAGGTDDLVVAAALIGSLGVV